MQVYSQFSLSPFLAGEKSNVGALTRTKARQAVASRRPREAGDRIGIKMRDLPRRRTVERDQPEIGNAMRIGADGRERLPLRRPAHR